MMIEDIQEKLIELSNRILALGRFELKATAERSADGLKIQVRGPDVPLLLAHNAELLNALEYICNLIGARRYGLSSHVVFDSGDYRKKREVELRLMAQKAAEQVRRSGAPFSFDPMDPKERRIIHLALADDLTVRTESKGDGPNRKVVIYPAG